MLAADPYHWFYLIGGNPWRKNGELRRIYFDACPGLRGQTSWEADNPGRSFPPGYFDVPGKTWVSRHSGWTNADYGKFMEAAIKRKTVGAIPPDPEVFTRDGVQMQDSMIVMFVEGQIPRHPEWGTKQLENKLMIAGKRLGSWYYGEKGVVRTYGQLEIPVREYADPIHPRSWVVFPMREEEFFEIEGRNFFTQWSYMIVDPTLSLISIDGGKRFADVMPAEPAPHELSLL